ncbi:PadR family transcriptional regulator [Methylobacterium gnaphalii]|uniref:Transcriptional regulator n=1 Tax=Methylobacterium gnaphalii TaxID=1010610 RepID=A0A512JIQ4_9HYPH|nr:transcriptional regulator [Methylobacterium gnaphalii]GJD67248.1 hypothetical protein MMMDOFMJ_0162 [Methylobacterium gnaphalii]GLS49866.1 transcriptional regulator [Methylobacterium gnaphalii]
MEYSEPRLTAPTLKLLRFLLTDRSNENSGAAISKATKIGAGTLYPLLARLESAGWVTGTWEQADPREIGRPKRRFYQLTGLGATRARGALADFQLPLSGGVLAWNT